jgi:hypothetical protein
MTFKEWKAMPDDIKIIYINAIREKYNAPNVAIAQMMGCTKDALHFQLKRLDLAHGTRGAKVWDKEGFFNWWKGIPTKEEPVEEVEETVEVEPEVVEEVPCEPVKEEIPCKDTSGKQSESESVLQSKKCVPTSGSMTYEGMTFDILSSISDLLGNAKVVLSVTWDVVTDDGR